MENSPIQQVTDSTIECCLRNSFFADMLQEIIPLDQRNKFLKKFSELKYPVVPEGDTVLAQQFPNVTSLSLDIGEFGCSALPVVFETFPKLKRLGLSGTCSFSSFSGLHKATIISHVEDGWPIERIPRRKSIMDFIELEVITFGMYFDIDPDMILYCLPSVPNLRQISFYWNESLSVPLLRDSVGHLERIVIIISKNDKDALEDVIVQVGEMLPNTCVRYIEL
ncbi:unnamed protein product [Allacma fusca]|uniref:Uncharacterized protein n=1 Tax=Allacma fusca TaxID=39272 RepID=A0A8J2K4F9_9HEXA|nr:unnamed protein product [Allacma fusca]